METAGSSYKNLNQTLNTFSPPRVPSLEVGLFDLYGSWGLRLGSYTSQRLEPIHGDSMTLEEDQAEMRARMQALKSTRRKSRAGTRPETKILQTPSGESASPIGPPTTKSDSRNASVNSPASGRCETCGRPTSNRRFCSRSCAAVANNIASPKRKPEGECQRCRKAVSRSRRYCEACRAIFEAEEAERRRRRQENYQTWLTPNGERREGPVIEMFITKTFKVDRNGRREMLTSDNTSGDLIDQLIGICFAEPPYLRKSDAMRHVSLLNELKAFECLVLAPQGKSKALLKDLPIRRLPFVLEQWVSSYFEKAHHPMMPAYAMDTGRLLEFHVAGYRYEWALEGIVEAGGKVWPSGTFDSQFRKYFTTRFGGLRVLCQVPESGHSIDQSELIRTLKPKDKFLVRVERCHLSAGWGGSGYDIVCNDSDLECDLMNEFCFTGELSVRGNATADSSTFAPGAFTVVSRENNATHEFSVSVPARWITHALIWGDAGQVPVPVPRWDPNDVGARAV